MVECKAHKTNTFPWSALRQYRHLIKYIGIKGVYPGIVLWMEDHDTVLWIPITTIQKLMREGKKSFHINYVGDPNYPSTIIPARKLRKFMKADYSIMRGL